MIGPGASWPRAVSLSVLDIVPLTERTPRLIDDRIVDEVAVQLNGRETLGFGFLEGASADSLQQLGSKLGQSMALPSKGESGDAGKSSGGPRDLLQPIGQTIG